MSQQTTEVLLDMLEIDDGLLRYEELLKGGLVRTVKRSFQQQDSEMESQKITHSTPGNISLDKTQLQSEKEKTLSTMDGKKGIIASEYKEEELKQFMSLLDFCKGKEITLDWKMAEKGMKDFEE